METMPVGDNEGHSVVSDSLRPHGYTAHGILQARALLVGLLLNTNNNKNSTRSVFE